MFVIASGRNRKVYLLPKKRFDESKLNEDVIKNRNGEKYENDEYWVFYYFEC